MKTTSFSLLLLTLASTLFAADPLTESIQKGLLEEEVNRNLEAAAAAYQDAVSQADALRQTAATALFRLGEVYRKQGRTNDAVTAYQRVLRDFSDESSLVKLSREHLALLGVAETATPISVGTRQFDPADVASLREELKLVELEQQAIQKRYENGRAEASEVRRVQLELLELQRKLPEYASIDRQTELLQEELKLAETDLEEMRRKIEVGAAPPLDEIPLRRRILSLQRELAAAKRGPATAPATPTADTGFAPATREEADELQRTQVLFRDSPDLVMNARNATGHGGTWLHNAASKGYLAVAEFLLANHARVGATDNQGWTPLHRAVESGHKRMCEFLLANGADVDATTRSLETPLQLAAKRGFREVAEVLLANGAQINAKGYIFDLARQGIDPGMESTALHWAAKEGFLSVMELLLARGADLEATDRGGRTPLMRAVLAGQQPAVKMLLSAGADINSTDAAGKTALLHAVEAKNISVVKLLLEQSANLETPVTAPTLDNQWTVLFLPVGSGDVEIMQLLLEHNANVNARAASGITPLHWAVINNASATLKLLLEHKADVNVRDNGDNTPLHFVMEGGWSPVVEALLAAGADPNAPGWTSGDDQPWFPLFRAVKWSGVQNGFELSQILTGLLLDHGADARVSTTNGWTALHLAAQFGSVDLADLLIKHGADMNANASGPQQTPEMTPRAGTSVETASAPFAPSMQASRVPKRAVQDTMYVQFAEPTVEIGYDPSRIAVSSVTPLHVAVASQHLELVRFLLEHGASVNAADGRGHTALHFAANHGNLDLTRVLLDSDADPNAKNAAGETPLTVATNAPQNLGRGVFSTEQMRRSYKEVISLLRERGAEEPSEPQTARPAGTVP